MSATPIEQRRRRHGVRVTIVLLACLGSLAACAAGGMLYLEHRLSSQLERIPGVFAPLADRPPEPSDPRAREAMNILLLGTDRRSEVPTTGDAAETAAWVPGSQRSDTMMVLHVSADRDEAALISIPRDAWVPVPGYGPAKINAAFSYGGPTLAVQTVEDLTGVRLDHLAVVDHAGFERLADALGGVTVTVPETVHDPANHVTWTAGEQVLDGEHALLYVRQRYGLPGGDLDRIRRQQHLLEALARQTQDAVGVDNPWATYQVVDAITRSVSIDDTWSATGLRRLALDLGDLSSDDLHLVTAPTAGFGWEGDQSVVYLDDAANRELWQAVSEDRVADWVGRHEDLLTAGAVR